MRHAAPTARAEDFEISVEPAFDFLSAEYRALYAGGSASAFQAPLWQAMLHQRLAPRLKARQKTIAVRRAADRTLVAVLPFVEQSSAGIRIVQPADFGLCDRNEIVGERMTLERIAADGRALSRLGIAVDGADLLLIRKVWEDGFDPMRLFPGARSRQAQNDAYVCENGTDTVMWRAGLRKKFTKEMGRLERQTARDFGSYEHRAVIDADEIRTAFEFLRIARRGRHAHDVLGDERFYKFYLDYAIEGARTGEAITYASYIAGEPAAVLFGLCGDGVYHAVLIGADVGGHARQSTGIQLLYRVIEQRMREGHSVFDMGLGDPGYKAHFRPRTVAVRNMTCALSPTGSAIALIYNQSKPLKNFIKGVLPNVR